MPSKRQTSRADNNVQLKDLAFSVYGWALEDKFKGQQIRQEIGARVVSSTPWETKVKSIQAVATSTPPLRCSAKLSAREKKILEAPQPGTARFMVVGYAKFGFDKTVYGGQDGKTKQAVGTKRPADNEIVQWDENVAFVVAEIMDAHPRATFQLTFFALLYEDGLCTPYPISRDSVFFRHEFRTTETNVPKRRKHWKEEVMKQIVRPGVEQPLSKKQQRSKRANDISNLLAGPNRSFGLELMSLVATFEVKQRTCFLDELEHLLKQAHADIEHWPLPTNEGLRAFADNSMDEFTNSHAQMVVKEVKALWPEVEHLTVGRVMRLKQLLEGQKAEITYFHTKPILWEGAYRLSRASAIENEALWVDELLGTVQRIAGKPTGPAWQPLNANDTSDILRANKAILEMVIRGFDENYDKLKERVGDITFQGEDVATFWATFAGTPDTASVRSVLGQIYRFLVIENKYLLSEGVIAPLREMVKNLDRLSLGED